MTKELNRGIITMSNNKNFINNDSGVAYGIFAFIAFIILMGAIVVWLLPVNNQFIEVLNIFINQGMVSQDTADAMEFDSFVINSMVFFIMLGGACWGIVRALEKRGDNI